MDELEAAQPVCSQTDVELGKCFCSDGNSSWHATQRLRIEAALKEHPILGDTAVNKRISEALDAADLSE